MKTYKSFTALVLIAALLASCSGKKDKKGQNVDETPLVELHSVHSEDVEELSEYTATVEAFKTNNISSSTGNRIKRILVDVGSNVRAGQAVVILDNVTAVNKRAPLLGKGLGLRTKPLLSPVKKRLSRARKSTLPDKEKTSTVPRNW